MSRPLVTNDDVAIVIEKHADMVRRICFLYLKNHADVEDVFQEVFLKFFLHAESLQDEEHQRAWLCRVTFNKCKDVCKSFWHRKMVSVEEVNRIEELSIPFASAEQSELVNAVRQLSPPYKELIYLHYYEGRTIPEIANMMQMNENTVYSRLRRAKMQLKKKIGEF